MKALSILQPWASLCVLGHKRIETRSWNTRYRGPLLIHASKGTKEAKQLCGTNMDCSNLFGIAGHWAELPFGAIIGMVQLVDVLTSEQLKGGSDLYTPRPTRIIEGEGEWLLDQKEEAFGNYDVGRYGWLLNNPVVFKEPIPCKGNLNLWNPSTEVMAQVEEQIKALGHGR